MYSIIAASVVDLPLPRLPFAPGSEVGRPATSAPNFHLSARLAARLRPDERPRRRPFGRSPDNHPRAAADAMRPEELKSLGPLRTAGMITRPSCARNL